MTMIVSIAALIVTYIIAIPIGIYSALHQYSIPDYIFSIIAFAGVSMPNFLLALILMVFAYRTFGVSIGGLFSLEYVDAPWTWDKIVDLLKHLPIPLAVIGLSGTAWLMRTMRATLLDEIHKPYVQTARAKGLKGSSAAPVSYPRRPEPDCQHHRLAAAQHLLRTGDRCHCARLADDRTGAVARPDDRGHVPCSKHGDDHDRPYARWHAFIGPAPGLVGSTHSGCVIASAAAP